MDTIENLKTYIFFLPVLIAVVVAWHCRKRGARFSRWLVYVLPFLLPVLCYFIQLNQSMDWLSLLFGEEREVWFILSYGCSVLTAGILTLLKDISAFVRIGIGELSFPELFCLHAGSFVLGFVFSIFLMIGASPDVGLF